VCSSCGKEFLNIDVEVYPTCSCGSQTVWLPKPGAGAVDQDTIEGGVMIAHGICNPDGSPKRYDSKSEIQKALKAAGMENHVVRGNESKKQYDRMTSGDARKGCI
jgi:DNA-directed RNA polymerase subunit RPC12/RpoP